jgi:hypothetical protein
MLAGGDDEGWAVQGTGHVRGGGIHRQDEAGFGDGLKEIGERDRRGEVDVGDAKGLKSAGEVLETVGLTRPGSKVKRSFRALMVKDFQSASPGLGGVILGFC